MTNAFPDEPMGEHPAAELIAAYLSGALSPPEAAAFETHLAGCRPCRNELTSARRLVRSSPSRAKRLPIAAAAAAAAILLLAVLVNSYVSRPAPDRLRAGGGGEGDAVPRLSVFAPADGDTVPRGRLGLAWGGQESGLFFHVTVTDPGGRAVWLRDTPDTALTLPADVPLEAGRTYYWYVDALDALGNSLTTGTHRFTVAR